VLFVAKVALKSAMHPRVVVLQEDREFLAVRESLEPTKPSVIVTDEPGT
jgi:hypothetical protein